MSNRLKDSVDSERTGVIAFLTFIGTITFLWLTGQLKGC
jgi:hypothetical protein